MINGTKCTTTREKAFSEQPKRQSSDFRLMLSYGRLFDYSCTMNNERSALSSWTPEQIENRLNQLERRREEFEP